MTVGKGRRDHAYAEIRVALGRRMRREREQRELTQSQIAKPLGVTQPRVSEWERGESFPSVPQLLRFCEDHGIGLERLFEGLAHFEFGQLPLAGLDPDDRDALERIAQKLRQARE